MTSEADGTSRRRPPTIDLTATEVETEKPAAAEASVAGEPSGERAASSSTGRRMQSAIGAVAGAIAMAAIFGGLWLAGYLPARETVAPPAAQGSQPTAIDQISARLDKIQGTLQAQRPEAALGSRLAAAEAATKSLSDSLAALTARVDRIAAAAQSALGQAKDASTAADQAKSAAQDAAQHGALETLAGRVAALEGAVKTLSADVANQSASAGDKATRLTVAAEALRAAVERGAPYQDELAAVKSLGVRQDATTPLEQFAANGVPSVAALAQELSALMPALRRAIGNTQTDNTYLGQLEASAQNLVHITPIDAPPGDDPSSIVARIAAEAARADIAGAQTDIAKLPASAKSLAAPWTAKANARDTAIAASRRIAAQALAALVGSSAK